MMIVVDIMACTSLKRRKKFKFFVRFGPLILCLLATFFIMAEPTRHVLSDNGVWLLCWEGAIPRINQTWNDMCVSSSLEYQCNVPCCVTMESYEQEYPDNNPPEGTRNITSTGENALNLTDPAWQDHFYYDYCFNPQTNETIDYLNSTTGNPNCNKDEDSVDYKYFGDVGAPDWIAIQKLECKCDACVFEETMQFLSPVGWIFTVTLTYSGFILLAVGALWNANIVAKLKKLSAKCRELKEARAKLDESAEGNRSAKASVAGSEATEVSEVAFDFGAPQEEECED
mmetsp:Transcript_49181/g.73107  ORF Transcript_49181/g.73107 Transcript_49181/m.73107 type:complete len:285 (-) Transcript_49181:1029-1883(-)